MDKEPLPVISDLYSWLDNHGREHKRELVLFRGQDVDKPLLPKVARNNPKSDKSKVEKEMLASLRRIGCAHLPNTAESDWDMLARAQHFGMATRLLDWTSNPLTALWFAAKDLDSSKHSYVYFYVPPEDRLLTDEQNENPLAIARTVVFRPTWNNPRIVAQSGWFTVHPYVAKASKYIALDQHSAHRGKISAYEVRGEDKSDIIDNLDQLGVNYQTMFPDLEGVCQHINWQYD